MELEKTIFLTNLFALYRPLLPKAQEQVLDLFLNQNFGLSEIALQKNISRQGVLDCIKKGQKSLMEYEEKLGFFEKSENVLNFAKQKLSEVDFLKLSKYFENKEG